MNTLLTCIQNEIDAMTTLVEVLKQEQAALMQAPSLPLMDEINAVTRQKNQYISAISQLSQCRKNELGRLGFSQLETISPVWINDEAQKNSWAQLLKVTKKAKELNRVNGLLITRHLMRNQSTLDVLYHSHRPSTIPTLYGSNGQSSTQRNLMRGFEAK